VAALALPLERAHLVLNDPVADLPVVVITGGQGGLGRALAAVFATGWRVLAPGRKELDVISEASVAAYFEALPRLDLLVANAGAIDDQPLARMTPESWDRIVGVNLGGAFLTARAALPRLRERAGQILFIGSRAGRQGGTGQEAYAAAKAGIVGFAQSLAREYGADGVRCNVVLPGFLETPLTAGLPAAAQARARAIHVLGRLNTPEETARAVAFLATLANVSGQVFQLDSRIDRWL